MRQAVLYAQCEQDLLYGEYVSLFYSLCFSPLSFFEHKYMYVNFFLHYFGTFILLGKSSIPFPLATPSLHTSFLSSSFQNTRGSWKKGTVRGGACCAPSATLHRGAWS